MTKEKRKENGTGQNAEPLKGMSSTSSGRVVFHERSDHFEGPFRKGVWIGFGTKKFKQNEAESEDDLKETSWADEKGLDMK